MAIAIPYTFVPNTDILSAEVNANFSALSTAALTKAGDTMTGTLTALNIAAGTTASYDIGTSGVKFKAAYFSGTVTANLFSGSGASLTSIPRTGVSLNFAVSAKTGTYPMVVGDDIIVVTSGTFTVTAFTPVGSSGRIIWVKNAGSGVVTVATAAGTIDGAATYSLSIQYQSVTLASDGTNWHIV